MLKLLNFFNKNRIFKIPVRPFVYIHESIEEEILKISIILSIQILLLFLSKSYNAVLVILSSVLGSSTANFISRKKRTYITSEHFSYTVSIIQGIIAGMLIPETYPPFTVFWASLFCMLIIKHFFGGFSYAWVNPVVITVIFLWTAGFIFFPKIEITRNILASKNPSQILIENGFFPIMPSDQAITYMLNKYIFKIFKVSIPEGYVSMLWDTHSPIPAFRFNFITLLSSILLFANNSIKALIPACFNAVYLFLVRFAASFFCGGRLWQGDMLLALLTSGTLFISFFVLGWYGTIPVSIKGKIIYGITGGIWAFIISGAGLSSCAMVFAVLITNILSVLIQYGEYVQDKAELKKMLSIK